ncbi:MAG: hypothetical protein ACM3RP_03515 [Chitinophagales bacterium]
MERTAALELQVFGEAGSGPVLPRLERLKEYLLPGKAQALALRLHAAEEALFERDSSQPLSQRLESLEKSLTGATATGPVVARLAAVLKTLGITAENPETIEVPGGTPVRVRLITPVSSAEASDDAALAYEVVEPVKVGGVTVIPAGSRGTAHIASATPARMFGKDAQLKLDFCTVTSADGNLIPMTAPVTTFAPNHPERSQTLAVGAGAAGVVLLGPAGAAGSLLVKGREVVFDAGTEFKLATAGPAKVSVLPH